MTAGGAARLCRLQDLGPVWTAALAGLCVSGGQAAAIVPLCLALSLAYGAGSALDDAWDAPIDRLLHPGRPVPSGAATPRGAMILGVAALLASVAVASYGRSTAAAGAALTLAGVIVLRVTAPQGHPAAAALAGACRGLVYVVAGYAAAGLLTSAGVMAAGAAAAYGWGLAAAADREAGGARLWPSLLLLAPFALTAPVLASDRWGAWLWFFALAWVGLCCLRLIERDFARALEGLFAAMPLLDALLIAERGSSRAVWAAAAGFPATLLMRKLIR